jgi:hypothetical protein
MSSFNRNACGAALPAQNIASATSPNASRSPSKRKLSPVRPSKPGFVAEITEQEALLSPTWVVDLIGTVLASDRC